MRSAIWSTLVVLALVVPGCERQDDTPPPPPSEETARPMLGVQEMPGLARETRVVEKRPAVRESIYDENKLVVHDRDRVGDATLVLRSYPPRVFLFAADGRTLHTWEGPDTQRWVAYAWDRDQGLLVAVAPHDPEDPEGTRTAPLSESIQKLDWDGKVQWTRPVAIHHHIEPLASGGWIALGWKDREINGVSIVDDRILQLGPDGAVNADHSVWEIVDRDPLISARLKSRLANPRTPHGANLLGATCVTRPSATTTSDLIQPGCVAVTLRRLRDVVILDTQAETIRWSWQNARSAGPDPDTDFEADASSGPAEPDADTETDTENAAAPPPAADGAPAPTPDSRPQPLPRLSAPVYVSIQPGGRLLVVDRGVWEVDPAAGQLLWELPVGQRERINGAFGNAAERLPDGAVLLTDVIRGRVRRYAAGGDLIWDYRQQSEEHLVAPLMHARNIPVAVLAELAP